jgi:hypothetical protein
MYCDLQRFQCGYVYHYSGVTKATQTNLAQTQPIGNIKSLGKSTNKLAKQVISFT